MRDGVIPMLEPAAALPAVQALVRQSDVFRAQCARQSAGFDARAAAAHEHLFDLAPS